jgi:O-antigen ligase/polysaccharide polymerase Wzy-like membrane protein
MWISATAILLLGYLCLSRTFAYLGVPQWNAFIGEACLAMLFLAGPRAGGRSWFASIRKLPALKRLWTAYALFLVWGIVEVVHGILAGSPPLTALRDLAFNYYPIYFTLGLWAGVNAPDSLPKLIRGFAWFNAVYGLLYLFLLSRVDWFLPGVSDEVAQVPVFPQPIYSLVAILGLLAYGGRSRANWCLLLMNAFVMLGMQFRTEWLAFLVGAGTFCLLMGYGKRVLAGAAMFAVLVAAMYYTNFTFPGPELRGGDVSIQQLAGRVVAPFQADLTDETAASGLGNSESEESTFVWRTVWWLTIWDSVQESTPARVWGFGYGYPLGDLVPYLRGAFIRTPHNLFFYALGYGGWIGVALTFLFQYEILRLLLLSNRVRKDPFGLPFWAAMTTFAMFFPLGETPYGAIPFYLILGWVSAPAVAAQVRRIVQRSPGLREAGVARTPLLRPQVQA